MEALWIDALDNVGCRIKVKNTFKHGIVSAVGNAFLDGPRKKYEFVDTELIVFYAWQVERYVAAVAKGNNAKFGFKSVDRTVSPKRHDEFVVERARGSFTFVGIESGSPAVYKDVIGGKHVWIGVIERCAYAAKTLFSCECVRLPETEVVSVASKEIDSMYPHGKPWIALVSGCNVLPRVEFCTHTDVSGRTSTPHD